MAGRCNGRRPRCIPSSGSKYGSQGYVQHRLLSAASAAEALHRSLHAPRSKLSYCNRLIRLAALPDAEAMQTLVPDVEQWAGQLVRAHWPPSSLRSLLTHLKRHPVSARQQYAGKQHSDLALRILWRFGDACAAAVPVAT
jgi:hypothetical protein